MNNNSKVVPMQVEERDPIADAGLYAPDVARIITNDPKLSDTVITLGDKEITIVDLPYDDYLVFLSRLTPLMGTLANQLGIGLVGSTIKALDSSSLISYCAED